MPHWPHKLQIFNFNLHLNFPLFLSISDNVRSQHIQRFAIAKCPGGQGRQPAAYMLYYLTLHIKGHNLSLRPYKTGYALLEKVFLSGDNVASVDNEFPASFHPPGNSSRTSFQSCSFSLSVNFFINITSYSSGGAIISITSYLQWRYGWSQMRIFLERCLFRDILLPIHPFPHRYFCFPFIEKFNSSDDVDACERW